MIIRGSGYLSGLETGWKEEQVHTICTNIPVLHFSHKEPAKQLPPVKIKDSSGSEKILPICPSHDGKKHSEVARSELSAPPGLPSPCPYAAPKLTQLISQITLNLVAWFTMASFNALP